MWSDWLVFCDYGFSVSALWCPLTTPTVLLGFLVPWTWALIPNTYVCSTSLMGCYQLDFLSLYFSNFSWAWVVKIYCILSNVFFQVFGVDRGPSVSAQLTLLTISIFKVYFMSRLKHYGKITLTVWVFVSGIMCITLDAKPQGNIMKI